jgi:hypothetical protein
MRPQSTCERPGSSQLLVKDSRDDRNDLLVWKWQRGDAFAAADVGEPSESTKYALCVYDSFENVPLKIASLTVGPGGDWARGRSEVWKYNDSTGAPAGITDVLLKSGASGKTRVRVRASGEHLPLPSPARRSRFFHQDGSVVVQLINRSSGKCWTSTFTTAKENSAEAFLAP